MRRVVSLILLAACLAAPARQSRAVDLKPGDILVADYGADAVILIDPGKEPALQTVVFQGPPLKGPRGVALDAAGGVLVADETAGAVFRIDPASPKVTATYSGPPLKKPYGIALNAAGLILVTDDGTGNLVSIDPQGPKLQAVCPKRLFQHPYGIALALNGDLVVADYGSGTGDLVRLSSATAGCPSTLSVQLQNPNGVVTDAAGDYYVSDRGAKNVVLVDAKNGAGIPVSQSKLFQGLRGIALQSDGGLLVADYVAGAVFQVDQKSGEVTRTFKGGWLKNPNGVAVVSGQGPPSRSSFTVKDGVYVWTIDAADLARYSTPLDLAGFMNQLVAKAGEEQVKDLVLLLQADDGLWWKKIQGFKATGATIQGKPEPGGKFQILSVSQG
jgi:sugar lactone lactonase YvrE